VSYYFMPRYKYDQFLKDLEAGAYAFPGGYPRYFITADGEALSFEAAKQAKHLVASAIEANDHAGGWMVIGCDINWEDATLTCAHTNKRIESAYNDQDKQS
jgi:hypothetical protein